MNWLKNLPLAVKLLGLAGVTAGALILAWLISPIFIDRRVDEEFPVVAAATAEMPETSEALPAPTEVMPAPTETMSAPTETMSAATTAPLSTEMPSATATPAEPVALLSGSFIGVGRYDAGGTATIYELPDGQLLLRFEDFAATNGPDLLVGFSGHATPMSSSELHDQGYLELERLKGNAGNQNYLLPAGIDLAAFQSVTIYCRAFSVMFGFASLQSVS
jgi:hypothetical protein